MSNIERQPTLPTPRCGAIATIRIRGPKTALPHVRGYECERDAQREVRVRARFADTRRTNPEPWEIVRWFLE